jgi:hypothetical protein
LYCLCRRDCHNKTGRGSDCTRGWQMTIPEDLRESYAIAQKVAAGKGWCGGRLTAAGIVNLIERIAALEARLARMETEHVETKNLLKIAEQRLASTMEVRDQYRRERDALEARLASATEAEALLFRMTEKLNVAVPILDRFVAFEAVRSDNPKIYDGPSIEEELKEANALIQRRKESK